MFSKLKGAVFFFFFQELLATPSLIIVGHYSQPKIVIMTSGHPAIVPWIVKAPGGTKFAHTQTSMACTSMGRSVVKECIGATGKMPMNP